MGCPYTGDDDPFLDDPLAYLDGVDPDELAFGFHVEEAVEWEEVPDGDGA